jgi:hypothetical protein
LVGAGKPDGFGGKALISLETVSCSPDESRDGNSSRSWNSNSKLEPQQQVRPGTGDTTIKRTVAIGGIHGCATTLETLIGAIDPYPKDWIAVRGDVIDWGPDSRGCVQQLIDLSKPLPC